MTFLDLMRWGPTGWLDELFFATLLTLAVALSGFLAGIVFGAAGAAAKLSGFRLARAVAGIYTTVIRGVPDLLIIYLFYFGGSVVLGAIGRAFFDYQGFVAFPGFLVATLALGVVSGAYQAEVFRGAYLAIQPGELEAARACGMSPWTRFRRIVVPQVLRFALPGLGNVWQLVLKESALVSVIGISVSFGAVMLGETVLFDGVKFFDLLRQAQVGAGSTRQPFTFYLVAAGFYLLLTTVSTIVFQRAEMHAMRGIRRL